MYFSSTVQIVACDKTSLKFLDRTLFMEKGKAASYFENFPASPFRKGNESSSYNSALVTTWQNVELKNITCFVFFCCVAAFCCSGQFHFSSVVLSGANRSSGALRLKMKLAEGKITCIS